jgi:hypothetical protein
MQGYHRCGLKGATTHLGILMLAEKYFRLVSSEQYCNLWVQWIPWIKSLNGFYFELVLEPVYSTFLGQIKTVMASQGGSILTPP